MENLVFCGLDVGYGYVKGATDLAGRETEFMFPSVVGSAEKSQFHIDINKIH